MPHKPHNSAEILRYVRRCNSGGIKFSSFGRKLHSLICAKKRIFIFLPFAADNLKNAVKNTIYIQVFKSAPQYVVVCFLFLPCGAHSEAEKKNIHSSFQPYVCRWNKSRKTGKNGCFLRAGNDNSDGSDNSSELLNKKKFLVVSGVAF